MASQHYFNNLVSLNDMFYASHSDLLDRICIRLGAEDRADELREELLDNKFKLKAKKDPNKPKRAANPYTFFSREYRDTYKKKNNGAKINFTEMNKTLGESWRKLSDKKKKKYNDLAEKDKERYQNEMEQYNANLGI
tara:strand:- start:77 stop:487 length:411 start_codon:yes stop_codon:yes gene_type:complete